MTNLLRFRPRGPLSSPPASELKFYELRNDALSVDGAPPRRGDICAVRTGEEVPGEPHMVWIPGGSIYCGILHRKGSNVTVEFLNPAFPPIKRNKKLISILGRVERFYCAAEGELTDGLHVPVRRPLVSFTEHQPDLAARPDDSALSVIRQDCELPLSRIVNWWADASGVVGAVSENWHAVGAMSFERMRDWGYISTVHPDERDGIDRQWRDALAAGAVFDARCRLKTSAGYWSVRLCAAPLPARDAGPRGWVGTLHLLEPMSAIAS